MSRLSAAVSAVIAQLKSHDARLDDLSARVDALEARLVRGTTAGSGSGPGGARDEAALALAEYQRQLDEDVFQPEAAGVTSAMRAERLAAVDAAERAASWLGRSGRNRDKEIYAAIGAGRKALIRLAATRAHRPVPMPLLTAPNCRATSTSRPTSTPRTGSAGRATAPPRSCSTGRCSASRCWSRSPRSAGASTT